MEAAGRRGREPLIPRETPRNKGEKSGHADHPHVLFLFYISRPRRVKQKEHRKNGLHTERDPALDMAQLPAKQSD